MTCSAPTYQGTMPDLALSDCNNDFQITLSHPYCTFSSNAQNAHLNVSMRKNRSPCGASAFRGWAKELCSWCVTSSALRTPKEHRYQLRDLESDMAGKRQCSATTATCPEYLAVLQPYN
ncbi:hypothetical protein AC578_3029 [Pseudocercospora eumusae]|uniref:Uncharacterized protein n=1 Tax=Pseudocercospora eumusae TaxID=321146 RepID=A0A139H9S4_9PEZI|nr:hypothetical protein AC578_3029 [Pseudocercospora eumusae]